MQLDGSNILHKFFVLYENFEFLKLMLQINRFDFKPLGLSLNIAIENVR